MRDLLHLPGLGSPSEPATPTMSVSFMAGIQHIIAGIMLACWEVKSPASSVQNSCSVECKCMQKGEGERERQRERES